MRRQTATIIALSVAAASALSACGSTEKPWTVQDPKPSSVSASPSPSATKTPLHKKLKHWIKPHNAPVVVSPSPSALE